jgi:hypothetical protein
MQKGFLKAEMRDTRKELRAIKRKISGKGVE